MNFEYSPRSCSPDVTNGCQTVWSRIDVVGTDVTRLRSPLSLSLSPSVNSRFFLANKRLFDPRNDSTFRSLRRTASARRIPQRGWIAIVKRTLRETRLGSRGDREKIGLSNLTWCRSREAWFVLRVMGS